ncbi:MAG: hypothetical protein GF416_03230 [Candidatus Altiarchaeales archaeon]|nr:hypothetical protein [Candidatus Altiarchaeales archaeon]MBD3416132.1 hypothetical protein [Candidatus Altiarchaeales archaeon]
MSVKTARQGERQRTSLSAAFEQDDAAFGARERLDQPMVIGAETSASAAAVGVADSLAKTGGETIDRRGFLGKAASAGLAAAGLAGASKAYGGDLEFHDPEIGPMQTRRYELKKGDRITIRNNRARGDVTVHGRGGDRISIIPGGLRASDSIMLPKGTVISSSAEGVMDRTLDQAEEVRLGSDAAILPVKRRGDGRELSYAQELPPDFMLVSAPATADHARPVTAGTRMHKHIDVDIIEGPAPRYTEEQLAEMTRAKVSRLKPGVKRLNDKYGKYGIELGLDEKTGAVTISGVNEAFQKEGIAVADERLMISPGPYTQIVNAETGQVVDPPGKGEQNFHTYSFLYWAAGGKLTDEDRPERVPPKSHSDPRFPNRRSAYPPG